MGKTQILETCRETFEILHGSTPTLHAELRVLKEGAGARSGCFRDPAAFAKAAAKIDESCTSNLYVTLNPVNFRSPMNEGTVRGAGKGCTAGDDDIASLSWILIDCDSVRPTNVCATDDEKAAAKAKMEEVKDAFSQIGWPEPVVADSGNGYHLLYPIDLPNDTTSRDLVKAVIKGAAMRFSSKSVKIDAGVFNPARITRLYGTMNRKGENSSERPWRRAEVLSVPESQVPVSVEQMAQFIRSTAAAPATKGKGRVGKSKAPKRKGEVNHEGALAFDMEGFLRTAKIEFRQREDRDGGWRWVLHKCPFNPEHDRGEVAVFVDRDGAPGFHCFHDSCHAYSGWQSFQRELCHRLHEQNDHDTLNALDDLESAVGYFNRKHGLFFGQQDKPAMRLGDPLTVLARVRCDDSSGWGVLLQWHDPDNNLQELVVAIASLVQDPKSVLARLADRGYFCEVPQQAKEKLVDYMQKTTAPSAIRADHPGWIGDAYVFPDEVIGQTVEPVHYVRSGSAVAAYATAGTLEAWIEKIGRFCPGNSRLVLAVCAAFAGPLLSITHNETGGIHFRGGTSTGKTTALRVAGSVCGGGGTTGYIRQWRATTNGLEAVAAAHNDGLLILDELGQITGRDMADAIYMLANQSGKSRATKDGGLANTKNWELMILSSGEISPAEHAAEAGRKLRGGVDVRLLCIPADAEKGHGLFENLHGFPSAAAFADHLKEQSKANYGTPLREYLRWLCLNRASALQRFERSQADFVNTVAPENAKGEVARALRRFAFLAAAGEMATEADVTGWAAGEALRAAGVCFAAWLRERGGAGASDIDKGVAQVLSILETQSNRFQRHSPAFAPPNRIGFLRSEGGYACYQIPTRAFKDVMCAGFDHRLIRDALIERGLMVPGDKEHPGQKQVRLPDLGQQWVYTIRIADPEGSMGVLPADE